MITSTLGYLRNEVLPRWRKILVSGDTALAIVVGLGVYFKGPVFLSQNLTAGAFLSALLAYIAVALGFSIAGLTLVVCNPLPEYSTFLANRDSETKPSDDRHPQTSFGDLIFVYSWTAVVHWFYLMATIVAFLMVDADPKLRGAIEPLPGRIWFSLAIALGTYCVCHFFVAILSLSEFSQVYIAFLRSEARKELARRNAQQVSSLPENLERTSSSIRPDRSEVSQTTG